MDTNQEILFAKTLEEVKKQAKVQGNWIERKKVEEAFSAMSLSGAQLQLVFDYLTKHQIGIDEPLEPEEYLSKAEMNYLEEYLKELSALKKVTDGEKKALTLSAMAGETDAQQELIHVYLPQVVEIARLYSGQGVFVEDLIGEGNVALAVGVTMLGCLEHPEEADGMLGKMIMDAMEECIHETLSRSDMDRKAIDRVQKVAKKAKELSEELRRKVTVEELSKETGISEKAIQDALRLCGYSIEGIDYAGQ